MTIGENIKRLRMSEGLKQAELAERLGKAPSVIANWEAGTNLPNALCIEKMCSIFNTDANTLFGWVDGKRSELLINNEAPRIAEAFNRAPHNVRRAVEAMLEPYMEDAAEDNQIGSRFGYSDRELERLHQMVDEQYGVEKKVGAEFEALSYGESATG